MAPRPDDLLVDFMMGPVRRYVEAWVVIFNPWLLLWEQEAVADQNFDLPRRPENKDEDG